MATTQAPDVPQIGLDDQAHAQMSADEAKRLLGVLTITDSGERTYTRVTISPPSGDKLYVKTRLYG